MGLFFRSLCGGCGEAVFVVDFCSLDVSRVGMVFVSEAWGRYEGCNFSRGLRNKAGRGD